MVDYPEAARAQETNQAIVQIFFQKLFRVISVVGPPHVEQVLQSLMRRRAVSKEEVLHRAYELAYTRVVRIDLFSHACPRG